MTRVCHPFYVTYEEEHKIINAIEESDRRYQHLKDMVKIALNTGMRQGEILGMKKNWSTSRKGELSCRERRKNAR